MHHRTLHGQFLVAAKDYADRPAVVDDDGTLSYREVDALSAQLATALRELLRPAEHIVAIRMSRSRFMPVGIIGILRAGSGYVPVDPNYPAQRQEFVLDDSRARLVVTDSPRHRVENVVGTIGPFTVVERAEARQQEIIDDLAYLIYTSGSTGKPKGCMVSHANVLCLFDGWREAFDFRSDDVWALFHSISFDFSVWELWGALLTGGTAVVVPAPAVVDPDAFAQLLVRNRVTVLGQTPSSFSYLLRAAKASGLQFNDLRYIVLGGEAIRRDNILDWLDGNRAPHADIVNVYGITETTVSTTYRRLTSQLCGSKDFRETPIGKPFPHYRVSLRDERGYPVADGQPGEIWVAGDCVTQGYLRRPELTAERFVSDDLDGPAQRYYRSGDWAVRDEHGDLYFIGRQDSQVKLRGFRIELGEIEAVLGGVPGVRVAACHVEATASGHDVLVAHLVVEPDHNLTQRDVRQHANTHLPAHMRPHQIRTCTRLPLTPSGKLDRQALRRAS